MTSARLVYHGQRAVITTPFSRFFVDDLKLAIPFEYREWIPELKVWEVDPPYDRTAADVLRRHFPTAEIEDRVTVHTGPTFNRPTPTCSCTADHRLLGICASAPPELVKAALRIAAKQHHPDLGGSTERMQAINAAAGRLLEEVRR